MANVSNRPDVKYIKWQEGMRVTGKYQMSPRDYGEYLSRSGKRHHNIIRRKRLAKAFN
ncbi:MAG: hypothetical protein IJ588_10560 [Prevotella sp.]|nr:hypothetical protein [Prevotella sp.]